MLHDSLGRYRQTISTLTEMKETNMKASIALLIALCLALTVATSPVEARGRATIIKGFECLIVPADSGLPILLFSSNVTHEIDTSSGNTILQCHFDIPEGLQPRRTLHHQGFLCGTLFGETTDSRSVTTRGGKVLLTCQIKHR